MTKKEAERQLAIKTLLEEYKLKPGDKLYYSVTHVSRSGMSRSIEILLSHEWGIDNLSWVVAKAINHPFDNKNGGVKIGGCGMDMGFAIIYSLGQVMFPEGFKTWDGYYRNEPLEWEPDGGYAFKYSSL